MLVTLQLHLRIHSLLQLCFPNLRFHSWIMGISQLVRFHLLCNSRTEMLSTPSLKHANSPWAFSRVSSSLRLSICCSNCCFFSSWDFIMSCNDFNLASAWFVRRVESASSFSTFSIFFCESPWEISKWPSFYKQDKGYCTVYTEGRWWTTERTLKCFSYCNGKNNITGKISYFLKIVVYKGTVPERSCEYLT